LNKLFNISI